MAVGMGVVGSEHGAGGASSMHVVWAGWGGQGVKGYRRTSWVAESGHWWLLVVLL